jgi:hypothetical protein
MRCESDVGGGQGTRAPPPRPAFHHAQIRSPLPFPTSPSAGPSYPLHLTPDGVGHPRHARRRRAQGTRPARQAHLLQAVRASPSAPLIPHSRRAGTRSRSSCSAMARGSGRRSTPRAGSTRSGTQSALARAVVCARLTETAQAPRGRPARRGREEPHARGRVLCQGAARGGPHRARHRRHHRDAAHGRV